MTVIIDGTNGVQSVSGSATLASITNINDTNTGMFFPASETIALATSGSERLRVDSAGNMGLGVTPSAWGTASSSKAMQIGTSLSFLSFGSGGEGAHIGGNTYWDGTNWRYLNTRGALRYELDNAGSSHKWYTAASGTAGNTISFTQAMTLDASGNLGLGVSPTAVANYAVFSLKGRSSLQGSVINFFGSTGTEFGGIQSDDNFGLLLSGAGARPIVFYTNSAERARISSAGVMLVGATAGPSGATELNAGSVFVNSNLYIGNSGGTAGYAVRIDGFNDELYVQWANASGTDQGGVKLTYAGTSWSSASDIREKQIIENIENAVDKLSGLRTVIGRYNNDEADKRRSFLIAQDVEAVFPEAVSTSKKKDSDEERLWLNYQDLIPVLVKAIQEQQAMIKALEAKVAAAGL